MVVVVLMLMVMAMVQPAIIQNDGIKDTTTTMAIGVIRVRATVRSMIRAIVNVRVSVRASFGVTRSPKKLPGVTATPVSSKIARQSPVHGSSTN